ncbi:colicin E5-related ribonuclease [Vibrio neptunius]|uniref:colicin E5-related ribonuclease n=1 Tax=Vibrio neptunius TaxID=170651 RepID=UPI003CE4E16A
MQGLIALAQNFVYSVVGGMITSSTVEDFPQTLPPRFYRNLAAAYISGPVAKAAVKTTKVAVTVASIPMKPLIYYCELETHKCIEATDAALDGVTKRVTTQFEKKIEKQMGKRGWDKDSVNSTIESPHKTVSTRDTRWNSDGTRRDEPATAYIREDGHYVVRNDNDGTIVQISNLNKADWRSPFE